MRHVRTSMISAAPPRAHAQQLCFVDALGCVAETSITYAVQGYISVRVFKLLTVSALAADPHLLEGSRTANSTLKIPIPFHHER